MKVKEVFENIRFNTSTIDDIQGRSASTLFSNKDIARQLKFALDKYAKETLAIESIYSLPLETSTEYIDPPYKALRSESYRYILVWLDGQKYDIDINTINRVQSAFSYQTIVGVPRWFMPWGDKIYIYPNSQTAYATTTIEKKINSTDTTIEVTDGSNLLLRQGRISINNEKIVYRNRTGNFLYECERGVEGTLATSHDAFSTVKENNCWFLYRKLHFDIIINNDNQIDKQIGDLDMEVPDDHIETITDYTSYKLLSKVDSGRAAFYKINFDEWLKKAKYDVTKGRDAIKKTANVRDPLYWESDYYNPYL